MADVTSTLTSWSSTAASNLPANSAAVGPNTLADNQRVIQAVVRAALAGDGTIASATTTDLSTVNDGDITVTGTTTITGLGTLTAGIKKVLTFSGVLTLTHNATSLILPGAANITTAAGDVAIMRSLGSGNWRCIFYQRAANVYAASGANTDITSLAAPALGAATATTQSAGDNSTKVATTAFVGAASVQIQPLSATVAANALTITTPSLTLDFRDTNPASATVTRVTGDPANLVISSGSTLGTINAIAARLVVIALNNAGTIELAVVNLAGGKNLDETTVISTTAEGGAGAADSASVIYSATARTNVAFRVIGFLDVTEATAGTWATAPSTIQGAGGQALAALSSLGYGQTWQGVTRTSGTTYYNTTGKPIALMGYATTAAGGTAAITIAINGASINLVYLTAAGASNALNASMIVIPPQVSYVLTETNIATRSIFELR